MGLGVSRAPPPVCGMGLLNLDQETAFGSVEASSVLSAAAAAAGAQEEKPRVRSPGNAAQDQVGRRWGGTREGSQFCEGNFSVKIHAKKWASELGVQGPDKTRRGDLPLPPPEGRKNAKPGEMGRKFPETPPRIRKNKKRHEILPSSK